ncbi:SVSP family protein [Theileria parva strain Muguga]|uniref:Uncharacterized protein n=1 Tax=Theileria parva TaxID=5875 RepID=Q4N6C8_THEPA|nr:SVSP family protein [Theileria parva strain Muguga]EAN32295.1 SVSP family protein [Theileria parva strain Muguga]|eukprot:XP_764578.1 hypothetical protein [Theileria parva strain Muguga]
MDRFISYECLFILIIIGYVRCSDKYPQPPETIPQPQSGNLVPVSDNQQTQTYQTQTIVYYGHPETTQNFPFPQPINQPYVPQFPTQTYQTQPINYYDHPQPINQPYVPQFQPTPQTAPVQYYVPTIIPPVPVQHYELSPHPMTQQPVLVQPYQLYVPAQITPQPQPIQQIPLQHRPYQHTAHHQFRPQYRGPRGPFRQEYHGPRYPRYRPPYYQPIRYGPPVYSYQQSDDYQIVQPVNNYGTPPIAEQSETTDKVKELQPELVKLELGSDSEDEYYQTTKGPEGIDKLSVEQPSQNSDQPSEPSDTYKELEPKHIPVEVKSDDEESISEPKKHVKK